MPVYKLYYFNARARAEGIRWLLSVCEVDFEDIRIHRNDWPAKKPDTPFGRLPVMEIDGELLAESQAIGRYLANKYALAGKSDWEKALADQYVDVIYDLLPPFKAIRQAPDEQTSAKHRKTLLEDIAPDFLGFFEKGLNSNTSGFLVGDSLTWADVFVASYLDFFLDRVVPEFGDMLKTYPKFQAHFDRIRAIPQIAAFIAKRPKTAL